MVSTLTGTPSEANEVLAGRAGGRGAPQALGLGLCVTAQWRPCPALEACSACRVSGAPLPEDEDMALGARTGPPGQPGVGQHWGHSVSAPACRCVLGTPSVSGTLRPGRGGRGPARRSRGRVGRQSQGGQGGDQETRSSQGTLGGGAPGPWGEDTSRRSVRRERKSSQKWQSCAP